MKKIERLVGSAFMAMYSDLLLTHPYCLLLLELVPNC